MHSNNNLSLTPHLPLVPEPPARFWTSLFARLRRPARTADKGLATRASAAAADMPLYEQAFTTEQEAVAWSANAIAHGYRTVVEQNVYDYSWQVDVYHAVEDDAGRP